MNVTDRRTDGWMDRAEFIGPSNTFANPKIDDFPIKKKKQYCHKMNEFPHSRYSRLSTQESCRKYYHTNCI